MRVVCTNGRHANIDSVKVAAHVKGAAVYMYRYQLCNVPFIVHNYFHLYNCSVALDSD